MVYVIQIDVCFAIIIIGYDSVALTKVMGKMMMMNIKYIL